MKRTMPAAGQRCLRCAISLLMMLAATLPAVAASNLISIEKIDTESFPVVTVEGFMLRPYDDSRAPQARQIAISEDQAPLPLLRCEITSTSQRGAWTFVIENGDAFSERRVNQQIGLALDEYCQARGRSDELSMMAVVPGQEDALRPRAILGAPSALLAQWTADRALHKGTRADLCTVLSTAIKDLGAKTKVQYRKLVLIGKGAAAAGRVAPEDCIRLARENRVQIVTVCLDGKEKSAGSLLYKRLSEMTSGVSASLARNDLKSALEQALFNCYGQLAFRYRAAYRSPADLSGALHEVRLTWRERQGEVFEVRSFQVADIQRKADALRLCRQAEELMNGNEPARALAAYREALRINPRLEPAMEGERAALEKSARMQAIDTSLNQGELILAGAAKQIEAVITRAQRHPFDYTSHPERYEAGKLTGLLNDARACLPRAGTALAAAQDDARARAIQAKSLQLETRLKDCIRNLKTLRGKADQAMQAATTLAQQASGAGTAAARPAPEAIAGDWLKARQAYAQARQLMADYPDADRGMALCDVEMKKLASAELTAERLDSALKVLAVICAPGLPPDAELQTLQGNVQARLRRQAAADEQLTRLASAQAPPLAPLARPNAMVLRNDCVTYRQGVFHFAYEVRAHDSRSVNALSAEAFQMQLPGSATRPPLLKIVAEGEEALDVYLLRDESASMNVRETAPAAAAFVKACQGLDWDRDSVTLLGLGERLARYSRLSLEEIARKLDDPPAQVRSALWDQLLEFYQTVAQPASPERKRLVILITDGRDDSSLSNIGELAATVRKSGIPLHIFSYSGREVPLRKLAEATGGRLLKPGDADLRAVLQSCLRGRTTVYNFTCKDFPMPESGVFYINHALSYPGGALPTQADLVAVKTNRVSAAGLTLPRMSR